MTAARALTDNCQIDSEIPGGRRAEVHPAAVDPLVVQLNPVEGERRRFRHGHEVGPGTEHCLIGPVQGLGESSTPHVEAETNISLLEQEFGVLTTQCKIVGTIFVIN